MARELINEVRTRVDNNTVEVTTTYQEFLTRSETQEEIDQLEEMQQNLIERSEGVVPQIAAMQTILAIMDEE